MKLPLWTLTCCVALEPWSAFAQTDVPAGNLVGSQSWTLAGSPYRLTGDLTVPAGVTLTVEAGVTVEVATGDSQGAGLDTAHTELRVLGSLAVNGNDSAPVSFRAGATSPSTGDWYGIVVLSGATANLTRATIQHAAAGIRNEATSTMVNGLRAERCVNGLIAAGGSITLTGGAIVDGTSYGIQATDSAEVTASGMEIRGNASGGVSVTNSNLTLERSIIRNNAGRGLYLRNSSGTHTHQVIHNTISANGGYGVYLYQSSGSQSATIRDSLLISNGSYGIYVAGSIAMTATHNVLYDHANDYAGISAGVGSFQENPLVVNAAGFDFRPTSRSALRNGASDGTDIGAAPFDGVVTPVLAGHLFANTVLTAASSPHQVVGDLVVRPGVTLTIEPGAVLRFAAGSDLLASGDVESLSELRVDGTLVADGTASRGITFASAAASPGTSDWYGIHLSASSGASVIDYATISDAQYGIHSSAPAGAVFQRSTLQHTANAGAYIDGGAPLLSELLIKDNVNHGVQVLNAGPTIQQSRIQDNGARGVYLRHSSGTKTVQLLRNTIVGNNGYGVYIYQSSGSQSVTARDNVVTGNGSYGFYLAGSVSMTATYNLVWGHTNNYAGMSPGAGSLSENPLFVSLEGRDLRPTSCSPSRRHASDGGDLGALPFDGVPTTGVQGHLYADTVWSGGPIDVLGDVTIEPGVTLTVQAGTRLRFASASDSMGAGDASTLTELWVLGRLIVDGNPEARVELVSAATNPAVGDWYGVRVPANSGGVAIENALFSHTLYAIHSTTASPATVSRTEVTASDHGVWVDGGTIHFDGLRIHDCRNHGAYVLNASPTFDNTLVYSNGGRGFFLRNSSGASVSTINHATVTKNNGYGVYIYQSSGSQTVNLRRSIITDNGSYGIYVAGSVSMSPQYNDVWNHTTNYAGTSAGTGSLSANPQFVDAAQNNYHLMPSSPAIDMAQGPATVTSDIEGVARPIDGDSTPGAVADIGAHEYNPSANRWPIADAGPDRTAHAGTAVSFDGRGSIDPDGTIVSWAWDFGDGASGTGAQLTHTFTGGTDRTVTLVVTDNAGATATDAVQIKVNLPPTAEAGPERFADPGESVSFSGTGSTDSDGTLVTYQWSFGDGASASGSTVTHQYASGGNYQVTLTVTDNDGATGADTTTAHVTGGGADTTPPAFSHTPITDGQPEGQAVVIRADITDASSVSSAALYYRAVGAPNYTSLAMSRSGDTFSGSIPGPAVTAAGVQYYLEAIDGAAPANTGRSPAGAPGAPYQFTVTPLASPTITHTPVGNGQPEGVAVPVAAQVDAPAGITSVTLSYRPTGGGTLSSVAMTPSGRTYRASIPAVAVVLPGVEYSLEARDTRGRVTTSPLGGGAHVFTVAPPADTTPPSITHTPPAGPQSAGQALAITATVTDASGVGAVTLFYRLTGAPSFASVALTAQGDRFSGQIPGTSVAPPSVEYYLSASDRASAPNVTRSPASAPAATHTVTVQRSFDLARGDLVISEIMFNPTGSETTGEWFEIYNTTQRTLDLGGLTFRDLGTDRFTIDQTLSVAPGAYFLLGRSSDPSVNGGVRVDYVYSGMALANTSDEIVIEAGSLEIDRVAYDNGVTFPHREGYSMSLEPGALDEASNDDGSSWCEPSSTLSGGDHGSPGRANDACQGPPDTTPPAISHTPPASGVPAGLALAITALVSDASGLASVELYHRAGSTGAFTNVALAPIGGGTYQGTIPAAAVTTTGLSYYLRAVDAAAAANEALDPPGAPAVTHQVNVTATDGSGPVISHRPIADGQSEGGAILIDATISDSSGVAEAKLRFRVTGEAWAELPLAEARGRWSASIPGAAVRAPSMEYELEATDAAPAANRSTFPASGGPMRFTVLPSDTTPPAIVHVPVASPVAAGFAVAITATVTDASGVAEVRVYHRAAGEATFASVTLTEVAAGLYRGKIPAEAFSTAAEYYLEATDASSEQNIGRDPSDAPTSLHSFSVEGATPDQEGPSITHEAISDAQPLNRPVTINAAVTDPSGVLEVTLAFRAIGEETFTLVPMTSTATGGYSAKIPAEKLTEAGVEYYLTAIDGSPAANRASSPTDAPATVHSFTVDPKAQEDRSDRAGGCGCRATGRATTGRQPLWLVALALLWLRSRRSKQR